MTPLPPKNLLAEEASPYLNQHKDNPVHWRPWSAAALEEARRLSRPILLSVGYAACHWCHVMAHESFENEEVASVMNRLFVNIKVDREERPDIDQIYMAALSATGEQGGWPLTMFLTPEGKPFWGGTYFPREARYGRPGFIQVLEAVHKAWMDNHEEIERGADTLTDHVRGQLAPASASAKLSPARLSALADGILSMVDRQRGGLHGAPKFPNAPFMNVLWLNFLQTGNESHRDAVLLTLKQMLAGGIFDHVGGGLARYATDAEWLVPHFEKMLFDNAQLIRLASWAYSRTGDKLFRLRIDEAVAWLLREMKMPGGAFASSLDADSEGEEGRFYLWTENQIDEALGPDAPRFYQTFKLEDPDNWEGDPILHRKENVDYLDHEEEAFLRSSLDRLREARSHRAPPGRDEKILVDWNGLTIASLVLAGRTLSRTDWIQAGQQAYRFIAESTEEGRLPHSILGTKRLFPAIASDYAAMMSAAVSLFEATKEASYLEQARNWLAVLDRWYADENGTGYYLSASDNPDVPMRIRGDVDDAVASSTSQIIEALLRLATIESDHALHEKSVAIAEAAIGRAETQRYGQAGIVFAASLVVQPMKLLAADKEGDQTYISVANRIPDPRRVDLPVRTGSSRTNLLPGGVMPDLSQPGAWLCTGQLCLPPIRDPTELEFSLQRIGDSQN